MQDITFPVQFTFNIGTLSNDFTAVDATGKTIAYVKQKMFKLKEDIDIFSDDTQNEVIYKIKADRWLDFSAAYAFLDANGNEFGKIVRKGWRSIWKAQYEIIDQFQKPQYIIGEENGWVKVGDALLGQIPILSILTGYLFNPTYLVKNRKEQEIMRLKKLPSFWGRKFELSKLNTMDDDDDDRVMLGLMMMILLERRRG